MAPSAPRTPHRPDRSAKIQRLVDLVAALLARRKPATFEELADDVPAYRGKTNAAAKRMFERDKLELRGFGVPIQTIGEEGSEESAYKLDTRDFYLPYLAVATPRGTIQPRRTDRYGYRALATLTFEPDELAAIAAAAARVRMLGDPLLTADVDSAMRKLAFDLPADALPAPEPSHVLAPGARADPETLRALWQALLARKRVVLDYRTMSTDARAQRSVEPYGLFFVNGHWYLAARDVEKDAVRNFRVSRIHGLEVNRTRAGTADYEIPPSFHLREHGRSRQAWELGDGDVMEAIVEIRRETGVARAAAELGSPVAGVPQRRAFAVRRSDAFARWLLSFAGEVVPVAPASLVAEYQELVARTRALYATPEVNR